MQLGCYGNDLLAGINAKQTKETLDDAKRRRQHLALGRKPIVRISVNGPVVPLTSAKAEDGYFVSSAIRRLNGAKRQTGAFDQMRKALLSERYQMTWRIQANPVTAKHSESNS